MNNIIIAILSLFEGYRMPAMPNDQYEALGKGLLAEKLAKFVSMNVAIPFVMLGFPFKSTNTKHKVLGELPDLAEQETLNTFSRFNDAIKSVYKPGIEMSIVRDGYVFNDILEVSDTTVAEYGEVAKDMGKIAPMKWYDMYDFYKGGFAAIREKVVAQFGITEAKLEADILTNPDVNYLYTGMVRFMYEELAMKDFISRNQHQKAAKALARQMMFRNEAYSNLVRHEFGDSHIRLSMHPSVNNGAKYSFQLIPNSKYSAWHSACLVDNGVATTIHREEAETAGYHLVNQNGRPYYYTT